ncbi:MAG: OB-fold putative lipoprotein [Saprospiraceae bacterium]|nr:OB-fold putative lipoprotein [Saprospiraceae bacterium]MCF8251367.1 OB-fold putative lipoprotein [Saprospiraceae bacterium]MCF8280542.1 OB-fold putative lipoprotein [Bacteroidales bacterium]MCF8313240.1 OB-fold putative lipoprotein [Saprospiraceae bacterium]MCF8441687.1 OB-fold putative lipoprotein [Saprospiraceae bacterium]
MKKLLLFVFLLVLVVGAFLFFRGNSVSGSPATVGEQDTDIKVEAAQLFAEFIQDETGANEKYLNKITEVTGVVSTVQKGQGGTSVVLRTNDPAHGVRCRFDQKPGREENKYKVGQTLRLKCICSGYVQDVEMVQCVER